MNLAEFAKNIIHLLIIAIGFFFFVVMFASLGGVAIGFLIYFFPSLIAILRKRKNGGAIFALNLFLGWTFIGWVAALIWSLKAQY